MKIMIGKVALSTILNPTYVQTGITILDRIEQYKGKTGVDVKEMITDNAPDVARIIISSDFLAKKQAVSFSASILINPEVPENYIYEIPSTSIAA